MFMRIATDKKKKRRPGTANRALASALQDSDSHQSVVISESIVESSAR